MNSQSRLKGTPSDASSASASSCSSWKSSRLGNWSKGARNWIIGIGVFGGLSLMLVICSLALAWLLALLLPRQFEGLAEGLIERVPALMIATPLGLILGALCLLVLCGLTFGIISLRWFIKRNNKNQNTYPPTSSPTSTTHA